MNDNAQRFARRVEPVKSNFRNADRVTPARSPPCFTGGPSSLGTSAEECHLAVGKRNATDLELGARAKIPLEGPSVVRSTTGTAVKRLKANDEASQWQRTSGGGEPWARTADQSVCWETCSHNLAFGGKVKE